MALRSSWEGFLRLNLISVPVKAYSTTQTGGGRIGFHMLHAKCNHRIRYKKVCPVHGEVPNDEIVSGYELAEGQYAVIKPEELKKLRLDADKSIDLDVFVRPRQIDPLYFTDRSYYLTPNGRPGNKPYAVLQKTMEEEDRYAVGTMVLSGRGHAVVVRPSGRLLIATVLSYADQVKSPEAFEDEIPAEKISPNESKLAHTLIEASSDDAFKLDKYRDEYAADVMKLIQRQSSGKLARTHKTEEPAIINLMDALKQSVTAARKQRPHRANRQGKSARGSRRALVHHRQRTG